MEVEIRNPREDELRGVLVALEGACGSLLAAPLSSESAIYGGFGYAMAAPVQRTSLPPYCPEVF